MSNYYVIFSLICSEEKKNNLSNYLRVNVNYYIYRYICIHVYMYIQGMYATFSDECYLCDFTNGQIWLPDRNNCHMFFVCEPIGYLQYNKHHMTCGDLWWQQDIHTCVRSMPDGCDVTAPINPYIAPSTTEGMLEIDSMGYERYNIMQIHYRRKVDII